MSEKIAEANIQASVKFSFNAKTVKNITSEDKLNEFLEDYEVVELFEDSIHNTIADTAVGGSENVEFEIVSFDKETYEAAVSVSFSVDHSLDWVGHSSDDEDEEDEEDGLDLNDLEIELIQALKNELDIMFEEPNYF